MWTLVFNNHLNAIYLVECEEFLAIAFLRSCVPLSYITMSIIKSGELKAWSHNQFLEVLRDFQIFDLLPKALPRDWILSEEEMEGVVQAHAEGKSRIEKEEGKFKYYYKIYPWSFVMDYLLKRIGNI